MLSAVHNPKAPLAQDVEGKVLPDILRRAQGDAAGRDWLFAGCKALGLLAAVGVQLVPHIRARLGKRIISRAFQNTRDGLRRAQMPCHRKLLQRLHGGGLRCFLPNGVKPFPHRGALQKPLQGIICGRLPGHAPHAVCRRVLNLHVLESFLHTRARNGLKAKLLRNPFLPCLQGVFIERNGRDNGVYKARHARNYRICLRVKRCKHRVVLILLRRHQLGGSKRVLLRNASKLCVLIFRPCVFHPLALRPAHIVIRREPLLHCADVPRADGMLGLRKLCFKGLPIFLLRLLYLRIDVFQRGGLRPQKAAPLFRIGAQVRPTVCHAGTLAYQLFHLLL